jgi:hypothetical protein
MTKPVFDMIRERVAGFADGDNHGSGLKVQPPASRVIQGLGGAVTVKKFRVVASPLRRTVNSAVFVF